MIIKDPSKLLIVIYWEFLRYVNHVKYVFVMDI